MSTTVKIHPRKDFVKKDGSLALYIWVTIDRKVKKYILDFTIKADRWDWKNMKVKGSTPNAEQLNSYITNTSGRAQKTMLDIQNTGQNLDHKTFEDVFFKSKDINDYFAFGETHIEINKGKLSPSYISQLKGELTKLRKFKQRLNFQDINHQFLADYEYYMRNKLQNGTNTVYKTFKRMKSIIYEAMRQNEKLYTQSPFIGYKLKTEPTNRNFLTLEELSELERLHLKLPDRLKNVLTHFLFSCFTGLRYQDIRDLKFRNIEDGRIRLIMHKTKDSVMVPLLEKAKKLLPSGGNSDDMVFNVLSNQKTNDYLKEIILIAKIDKQVSFHCARHTFATTALNKSIPLEVVQKLLGHREIKTTQVYAKMMNETIDREMKKME